MSKSTNRFPLTNALIYMFAYIAQAALYPCTSEIYGINASDHITLANPFQTPRDIFSNGSNTWTWTLVTKSDMLPTSDGSTELEQHLRLTIEPETDLITQRTYLGCGAIVHCLSHHNRVAGQNISGDTESAFCNTALSSACRETLPNTTRFRVFTNEFSDSASTRPDQVCDPFRDMLGADSISKCKDDFGPDWWIEPFLWAGAALGHAQCPEKPGPNNLTRSVYTWGQLSYNSTDLGAYNNLVTLIEPIITAFFVPGHQGLQDDTKWAEAHIMCLRTGRNVTQGSHQAPAQLSSSQSRNSHLPFIHVLLSCVLTIASTL